MKALTYAVVLLACAGLSLVGCTDQAQSPVAPTDNVVQAPASLQKDFIRPFLGREGPNLTDPGLILYPTRTADGKTFGGFQENTYFHATFSDGLPDLLTGKGVLELNYWIDNTTFEGFSWGKLTVDPDAPAAGNGVWEISWHGRMWVDMTTGQTIAPLQWVGHGKGGAVNGMQLRGDDTIYLTDVLHWEGRGGQNDYVVQH
jgi:hypothetical protein